MQPVSLIFFRGCDALPKSGAFWIRDVPSSSAPWWAAVWAGCPTGRAVHALRWWRRPSDRRLRPLDGAWFHWRPASVRARFAQQHVSSARWCSRCVLGGTGGLHRLPDPLVAAFPTRSMPTSDKPAGLYGLDGVTRNGHSAGRVRFAGTCSASAAISRSARASSPRAPVDDRLVHGPRSRTRLVLVLVMRAGRSEGLHLQRGTTMRKPMRTHGGSARLGTSA